MESVLKYLVLLLLVIGSAYDYKYRAVGNHITVSIAALSCVLIYYNFINISIYNLLFIVVFIALYRFGHLGGADIKVLPFLILSVINPITFVGIISVIGLIYMVFAKNKNSIPYFIPMTIAYMVVISYA